MNQRPLELALADTRRTLYSMREQLPMFVVYDHPDDHPEIYVARLHLTLPRAQPTGLLIGHEDLDTLRSIMDELGLTQLARSEGDDPKIIEVWL